MWTAHICEGGECVSGEMVEVDPLHGEPGHMTPANIMNSVSDMPTDPLHGGNGISNAPTETSTIRFAGRLAGDAEAGAPQANDPPESGIAAAPLQGPTITHYPSTSTASNSGNRR